MRSLEGRLLAAVLLTVAAGLALVGTIAVRAVTDAIEREFDGRLRSAVQILSGGADVAQDGHFVATAIPEAEPFGRVGSGWYWMIAGDGGVLVRSRSLRIAQLPLRPAVLDAPGLIEGPDGRRLRALSVASGAGRPRQAITITATAPQDILEADLRRATTRLLGALAAGAVLTAAATAIAIRRALRPLAATAAAVPRLAAGELPALPVTGYREIDALVAAVNELLGGARETVIRSRLAGANLAHALKTPLAALRSRIALSLPGDREVAADLGRLDRQIASHLGRVPSLVGAPLAAETVRLAPVLDDVRLVVSRSHPDSPVEIGIDLPPDLAVAGDREALEEMFGALVGNAAAWARRRVAITAAAAGQEVGVTIRDDGPGMSAEEWLRAQRPGERLDASGPGAGLGLPAASEIAAGLGGRIERVASATGGLTLLVTLRRRTSPDP